MSVAKASQECPLKCNSGHKVSGKVPCPVPMPMPCSHGMSWVVSALLFTVMSKEWFSSITV